MDSLQNVLIDQERIQQMRAYVRKIVKEYEDTGGKEEGRAIVLTNLLLEFARVLYTAAFCDGFLDSTPRFMVQNKFPKLF